MTTLAPDATLPHLRPELQVMPGIREVNGTKTWLIFDPLRHQYFQINDKSRLILENWQLTISGEIVRKLDSYFVTLDDIEELLRFLWANSLTLAPPNNDLSSYSKNKGNVKRHWLIRLLHGYLFVVVPLIRPDKFLKKTLPFTRLFFTRFWWVSIVCTAVLGLYLTSRQWDQFLHTFMHFFSLEGLVYYVMALAVVKLAHEFGHAYAATRYGCRIKSMGFALIVMFPVLYTDTTDSWRLNSRRKRLVIGAAGVAIELSIAAIATLIWALSVDGPIRSTAFFVATTSWIMSVAINMNPLMRFDAYYFLSDLLGVQNLQGRSFAFGQWSLRKGLFGLKEAAPEALTRRWRVGLTVFAWSTWVYRFFLFLGIAIIVHQMIFWPFGGILAVIEVMFFIAIPIMNEIKRWFERGGQILVSPMSWVSACLICFFMFALFAPWQSTIRIPAVLESGEYSELFAAGDGVVEEVRVQQGDQVIAGDILAVIHSAEVENQINTVNRRIDLVQALLNRIAADEGDLDQNVVLQSELVGWQEELAGLQAQRALLNITAPFTGIVSELNPTVHEGRWVGKDSHLITVNTTAGARVRGFVERGNLSRISVGSDAVFIPELPELEKVNGQIKLTEAAYADEINIPALASVYGGPIAVAANEQGLQPLKAWYHISMNGIDNELAVKQQMPGTLLAQGDPESIAVRIWRRAAHVLLREFMG